MFLHQEGDSFRILSGRIKLTVMNPLEWLKALYGAFGAQYPRLSLFVVTAIGAIIFFTAWRFAAYQYHNNLSTPATLQVAHTSGPTTSGPSIPTGTGNTTTSAPNSPVSTGNATATGKNSIAVTGNGNTITNGQVNSNQKSSGKKE